MIVMRPFGSGGFGLETVGEGILADGSFIKVPPLWLEGPPVQARTLHDVVVGLIPNSSNALLREPVAVMVIHDGVTERFRLASGTQVELISLSDVTPKTSPAPTGVLMGWAVGLIGILGLVWFVTKR